MVVRVESPCTVLDRAQAGILAPGAEYLDDALSLSPFWLRDT